MKSYWDQEVNVKLAKLHVFCNRIKVVFIGLLTVYYNNVTGLRDVFGRYFNFADSFAFFFPAVSMIYLLAQR